MIFICICVVSTFSFTIIAILKYPSENWLLKIIYTKSHNSWLIRSYNIQIIEHVLSIWIIGPVTYFAMSDASTLASRTRIKSCEYAHYICTFGMGTHLSIPSTTNLAWTTQITSCEHVWNIWIVGMGTPFIILMWVRRWAWFRNSIIMNS